MARPRKEGLDYFPHSCISDQRIDLVRVQFGLKGYAVIYRLYEKIYLEKGYFCEWTDDIALMFAHDNGMNVNVVSDIVNAGIKRGIFDRDLFEKYQILTSKDIQETYLAVVSKLKRTSVSLIQEYLLADCTLFGISSEKTLVSSEKIQVYSIENPQKKRKESKEKEKKTKESKYAVSMPLRDGSMYQISENTVNQLQQLYVRISVIQSLRKMADFLYNNTQKRRDYLAMDNYIRWWLEQDSDKVKSETQQENSPHQQEHKPNYDISILDGIGLLD